MVRIEGEVGIHWLTLRFSSAEAEGGFLREDADRSLPHVRASLALGLALYAAFGALDPHIIPEGTRLAWAIRFGAVCPLIALLLALSLARGFRAWMQEAMALVAVVAGAGIVAMTVGAGERARDLYYAGLLLVAAFTYTFMRLRFVLATVASWGVAGLYVASLALGARAPPAVLASHLAFLASINLIGMSACYSMERSARRDFLQRRLIAGQSSHLDAALGEVKVLSGLLPICAWCQKVRDDAGYWQRLEAYVSERTDASFSHGICPECEGRLEGKGPGAR